MRTEFLCIYVLRVASEPRVKLASCKSALNPPVVCSTDRSKAVVPVLVLLFVALWFILRGDLLYVFPCVILFLCCSVLLVYKTNCDEVQPNEEEDSLEVDEGSGLATKKKKLLTALTPEQEEEMVEWLSEHPVLWNKKINWS